MSYINNNLIDNEEVIYEAKIHWFIFVPSVVFFLLGIISDGVLGIFLIAIILFIKAIIVKTTTELAITSNRVVAKTGLISRSTIELNHSKVESLNIDQSIFGRLFGFGTLIINGTGGGKTPIPNIDRPLAFRKNAMLAINENQSHR